MFAYKTLLLASLSAAALASPASFPRQYAKSLTRRAVTPNSEGTNNGFFYSMWSDSTGDVQYTNGADGQYSLTWQNSGDVVAGKGFMPGSARNITYDAQYEPQGISFLSVYGWFKNPLTEYYIVEDYGSGSPAGGDGMQHKGSLESDGSTYDVYTHQQVNAPSIQGTTNFMQYWSIRKTTRTSGTINTANHFDYWKSIGLPIGEFHYQIVATEGVKSSGSSTVTVTDSGDGSSAGSDPAPAPAPAPASSSASASAAAAPTSVSSAVSIPSAVPSAPTAPATGSSESAPATGSDTTPDTEGEPDADTNPEPDTPSAPAAPAASSASPSDDSGAPSLPSLTVPSGGSGSFPGAGSFTPGAGFPGFGGQGYPTPSPRPSPHFHHGHHGHRFGQPPYPGSGASGSAPDAAAASSAAAVPVAAASAPAASEGDDCQ